MPKVTLKNTETGKLEDFEPIDAREVLAAPNSIYTVPEGASAKIGVRLESGPDAGINIPQMHGFDAEMQTGNSADKYGREAIVKAQPGMATVVVEPNTVPAPTEDDPGAKLKVAELKAALDAKGVSYPALSKKADLQALLDASV